MNKALKLNIDKVLITCNKVKSIDIDSIKLAISVKPKEANEFIDVLEFEAQYNVRTNTCHINDLKAEHFLDLIGIDIDDIRDQIENRKIQIC